MGWNEWPLMLFTVLAQSAIGGFWWIYWALSGNKLNEIQRKSLQDNMIMLWILTAFAFVFSSLHLGSPLRAPNALFRIGFAPLSNEIFFGSLFMGLGVLFTFLSRKPKASKTMLKMILLGALICSFGFLWNMAAFYQMPTIPTWNTAFTPFAFVLTALLAGSAIAALLFVKSGINPTQWIQKAPVYTASLALLGSVILVVMQSASLAKIQSAIQTASHLSPNYGDLMGIKLLILFVVLAAWRYMTQHRTLTVTRMSLCFTLVVLAELIGRGVFYALYMSVGVV